MVKRILAALLLVAAPRLAGAAPSPAEAESASAETEKASAETEKASAETEKASAETEKASAETESAEGEKAPAEPGAAPVRLAERADQALAGRIRHAPVSFARSGEPLRLRLAVEHAEHVRGVTLVVKPTHGDQLEVPFERAPDGPYAAIIPAEVVRAPSIGYSVEIESDTGGRSSVFATRQAPHQIQVVDAAMDSREQAALTRVGGRRSVVAVRGDYVGFGSSEATLTDPTTGSSTPMTVDDRYYRIEGAYSYRMLRTVSEFGIRIGVVRGTSPVKDASSESDFDVGLNYGAPWVRFRLVDLLHVDGVLLSSVTEEGFSAGAGGAVHIGDIFGSQLELGFETVQIFGTRVYSRVDVQALSWLMVSATVEAADTPHASRYGVRLLGELGFDLGGGFVVAPRGGYQARDSASGGPSFGLTVTYAF